MSDYGRIRLAIYGGKSVGKSAIIRRLLGQGFNDKYRATVQDLHSHDFILGPLTLKVDLIDTSGDQEFPAMRELSNSTSHAFLLVYSICSSLSFDYIRRCFSEIQEQRADYQELPIVIAGNKSDLSARREVKLDDVRYWAHQVLPPSRVQVIECSAKEDRNIREVFKCFVTLSKIVTRNPEDEGEDPRLKRRSSAYGSRRTDNAGKSGPGSPGGPQVLAAQGPNVVAMPEEAPKSKPRSRSLIRRSSRKTKQQQQQLRDSHTEDCAVS